MRIFLVRHGQSLGNVDQAVHEKMADHAIPLSTLGREQAKKAAEKILKHRKEDPYVSPHFRVWESPYLRTKQTADEMYKIFQADPDFVSPMGIGIDRRLHVLLCEQQFGLFDGIPDDKLPELYPAEHAHYEKCLAFEGKFWAPMPLGESRFDVAKRVHQAFGTFHRDNDRHNIKEIVVVCHGTTLRAFVMMWLHYTPEWFDAEPNPENGAVRVIENGKDLGYI